MSLRETKYLTVIATGLLLPLELYEIARKPTALRVAVLLANLAILAYLIVKLIQAHRARGKERFESESAAMWKASGNQAGERAW